MITLLTHICDILNININFDDNKTDTNINKYIDN